MIETYEQALAAIETSRNKTSKKVQNNTTIHKQIAVDGTITVAVKLHNTFVVIMHPDHSVYYSGGFWTMTTLHRINQFGLCPVSQKKFQWILKDGTHFEEGIVVNRAGVVAAHTPQCLEASGLSLKELVQA